MSSSRNCEVTFPNVCRWSERSFWPFIKPCFSDSVLSSAGGDLCGAVSHQLPCLTNSFLFQKSPYQTQHSLPACCIFHLLRCVIYKHFYRISCVTQGVISPSFASGVTKHSKRSAPGIWSGFNFKRCVTVPAVPTGWAGKAVVLSLHAGLCFCDKLVLYICSLSWSEQRKPLSLLLSSK